MLRIFGSVKSSAYCDGLSRRTFVQLGVVGMASAGLGDVLRAKALAGDGSAGSDERAVILLWLDGGPGHMDLYDMKPDAPVEYRGIWNPIATNVPGIQITELFPRQAKVADKFAILRSLHHNDGDHFGGSHRMLTTKGGVSGANREAQFPGIGAEPAFLHGGAKPTAEVVGGLRGLGHGRGGRQRGHRQKSESGHGAGETAANAVRTIHQTVSRRVRMPSNIGRPSVPPCSGSIRFSGCGIIPRIVPPPRIPAMLSIDPFGLADSDALPAAST